MLKSIILMLVISTSSLAYGNGFWGTCIGVWAKAKSYLGLGGAKENAETLTEISDFLLKEHGVKPETLEITKKKDIGDYSFTEVQYGKKTYPYDKLPDAMKAINPGEMLFYGKGVTSLPDAIGQAKSMFAKGRYKEPGSGHTDIKAHIESVKYNPSMFMQTTRSFQVAEFFAQGHKSSSPKDFGVVFIIDAARQKVLDVDRFLIHAWKASRFIQQEVLLYQSIKPERVAGAVVIAKQPNGEWKPVKFLQNSLHLNDANLGKNWKPQRPVENQGGFGESQSR